MNYFNNLETILLEENPKNKINLFYKFYKKFKVSNINFNDNFILQNITKPSYHNFVKIVSPNEAKPRKYMNTKDGKISLLHTIAHIEYSAIDLALDAALRFKNLPREYYEDWLEVAEDEIRHFLMIEKLLNELDVKYGDIQVHTNLFEAMKLTPDLLSRMAVVPRYLEANGLEQNPKIMEKLKSNPDEFNKKILYALNIILKEEITHVTKGDKWFKYECSNQNLEPESTYLKILEQVYPGSTNKKYPINFEARKQAGFSCNELKFLSKKDSCN
ncbi:hypothetical protein CPU12_07000 [Malaciobacter molluscorum LMG 25693]|uniref:DUF455 domain-containing protein n=1 Tax=Malaciobacter molluscorum LMG 25693 TaxID=870501 RepID=A0A2G1DIP1_9BACT|nr:ferritin-like domain-containing protein [Malaciobacter molluscorum]AXX92343.1 DUF455 domain-containing protein [Malaciobacter molluscorum LMG 25693]PHO18206.1 hypothetical protein CPU12_07000 [Malaciobacter molluscorum LMG 25693]RXJ93995.1 hypothetical protein CRV00_08945 [Malaciobacter molluscorum]